MTTTDEPAGMTAPVGRTGPPLRGIRVLELTHAIAGPHSAQILADHGADVIKVEPPTGDRSRAAAPVVDGVSLYFACHNRGKRSIAIDLRSDQGHSIFMDLVRSADVVLTNYGADVPKKLKIDYDALAAVNDQVIFVHITGFGASGPYSSFGAYDGIIQAMSGLPSVSGESPASPTFAGAFVADHLAATEGAIGVLLALAQRARVGRGSSVDVSMLEGYMSTLAHFVSETLDFGREIGPQSNRVPTAFANTFAAEDGKVYLAPLGPEAWRQFCTAIEAPGWMSAAAPAWVVGEGRSDCEDVVAAWCGCRRRKEIVRRLREVGVPCGPVSSVREALSEPVVEDRGAIVQVETGSGQAVSVPGPPVHYGLAGGPRARRVPDAGEDGLGILESLGYEKARIAEMLSSGATGILRSGG